MKKHNNILLFIFVLFISSIINISVSKGSTFVWGIHNGWESIFNVLTSSLIFILIINLNLEKLNKNIKKIIIKISELSLGMYLASAIVDNFIYNIYFKEINLLNFQGYFKVVPLVIILSISLSMIINIIYKIINKYIVNNLTNIFIK